MNDNRDIGYSAIFLGVGIWFFFWGFMRLRRKRKIENIPTSTVRGLAMGLVEVIGKAKKRLNLISPLSGTECTLYRYSVERYKQSGRSGHWVTIARGDSFVSPFWLDDGTGKILVFPHGSELILPVSYEFRTGLGRDLPAKLIAFLEENNISYSSFLGNRPLRFKEWLIHEDDTVYVLGTAKTKGPADYLKSHNEKLTQRLEELKNNPQEMSKVDLNQDGEINAQEWDLAVSKIERQLLEEELRTPLLQESPDALIGKGEGEVYIISDYSQKELLQRLTWESFLGVFGGTALTLGMLGYLLFRLNICRF
jgi:hypothetical protein